jgi:hypothetical protein
MAGTSLVLFFLLAKVVNHFSKHRFSVAPRISWKGSLGNFLLAPLAFFQISPVFKPLKLESLQRQASKATKGLKDFGDKWYEGPYRETMAMVNSSSYSPIGRAAAHDFFLRRLIARLRLNDHLAGHACLNTPVRKPIFVVGLPRTGTTFLHRLLSLDPAARAPRTYELFDPVPRNAADPAKDRKGRIKFVQAAINKLETVVPHFSQIHELGADLPEECMMSIGMDIPMLFATFHVLIQPPCDSYKWKSGQAYKNYARVLQLLQHQAKEAKDAALMDKRWTLKCPVHLGLLPFLSEGFPDATIVWTHREPTQAIASLASFIRATQDMHEGSGEIRLDKLGANAFNFGAEWIKRADTFLGEAAESKHPRHNVMYTELIKDPVATVKNLYKQVGYDFTPEYEARLVSYIAENNAEREKLKKSGAKSLHTYTLEEYGLEKEQVEESLGWYKAKYFKK